MTAKLVDPIKKFSTVKVRVMGTQNADRIIKLAADTVDVETEAGAPISTINGVSMMSVIPSMPGSDVNNSFVLYRGNSRLAVTSNCTFLGYGTATAALTSAINNTLVGQRAGLVSTTCPGNVCVGAGAGIGTTTGACNTFVGYAAGVVNTIGSQNVALGYSASPNNPDDTYSISVGSNAHARSKAVCIGPDSDGDIIFTPMPIPTCGIGNVFDTSPYQLAIRESAHAHIMYNEMTTATAVPATPYDMTPEEAVKGILVIVADPAGTVLNLPILYSLVTPSLLTTMPHVRAGNYFEMIVVNDGALAAHTLTVTSTEGVVTIVGQPIIPGKSLTGASGVATLRFMFTGAAPRGTPTGCIVYVRQ